MPDCTLQATLENCLREVLDRMFFITASPLASDSFAAEPAVRVRLMFEGHPSGSLQLTIAAAAARPISADFLGMDAPEVSEFQIGEVVCELANMVCGAVLSRVESSATFRLSAPAVQAAAPLAPGPGSLPAGGIQQASDAAADRTICSLETGSGAVTAVLTTEGAAWPPTEKLAY